MFLHLGEDITIPIKDIIGIFDNPSCLDSLSTKELIEVAKVENKIIQIGPEEKNKSFILTTQGIYFSQISALTLLKRRNNIFEK